MFVFILAFPVTSSPSYGFSSWVSFHLSCLALFCLRCREIALSLERLGIHTEDTRDEQGRERFFVLTLTYERNTYRAKEPDFWYFEFSYYPPREGENSSSPWWIGSHYMSPTEMLLTEAVHSLKCEGAGEHPWKARVQA